MNWTNEEIDFLLNNYPQRGLVWCAQKLNRKVSMIRSKAFRLNLKQDKSSEFFKDWQARAAKSKIGKKRPDQALVIKKLHKEGKLLKTAEQKKAVGLRIRKYIDDNGHPKGALGMKHSEETKQKIGEMSKANYAKLTDEQIAERIIKMMKTKVKNGTAYPERKASWKAEWRTIGENKKYYRSKWEANYARYLEWLKSNNQIKDWKHEPTTFWFEDIKRGVVSYLPDFLVTELNGNQSYHEVKGWMDPKSKTKLKRMAKYYPHIKIVLIQKKEYESIKKTMSSIILDWE